MIEKDVGDVTVLRSSPCSQRTISSNSSRRKIKSEKSTLDQLNQNSAVLQVRNVNVNIKNP